MNNRVIVLREAARKALLLRRSLSLPREHPVNVFDVATAIGVEVQFMNLPSLEGMFYRGPDPKIILPSLNHRSRGRVSFSCAHETGHFQLRHGTRVDEYLQAADGRMAQSPDELAADMFASTLLMPRPAVLERFTCRGWSPETATPIQLFCAAVELDVGYATLAKHLRYSLGLVNDSWLKDRQRTSPKNLRAAITNRADCRRVVVMDGHWPSFLPIDLEVGDCVAVDDTLNLKIADRFIDRGVERGWRLLDAQSSGETSLVIKGVSHAVRIARSGYCGLLRYRFTEESEDS